MRWEMLFADLEGQLGLSDTLDLGAAVAELTRAEAATIRLDDRLRAAVGSELRLMLSDGSDLQGELREVYPDWILVVANARETMVPMRAVDALRGAGQRASPRPATDGPARPGVLSIGHALRGIARDRTVVSIRTRGRDHVGRIARVARDHLDVGPAFADSRDRGGAGGPGVDRAVTISLASIVFVSST